MFISNKIVRIFIVISILFITLTLNGCKADKKTFTKFNMTIELTEDFEEIAYEGVAAYYVSQEILVMCHREPFTHPSIGEYYTVYDFARLCLNMPSGTYYNIRTRSKYVYYVYEQEMKGEMQRIVATFHEASDAFWLIQFCTHRRMYVERKYYIFKYADSIQFN